MKFGIAGPGHIADRFASVLAQASGCELEAVASRDLERAKQFAGKHGSTKAFEGYDKLVRDPDVDAVYVALPHNAHLDVTLACLEQGKAVLCEKPLSTSYANASRMIEKARAENVLLMEGMWTRCLPAYLKAREWLSAGRIGQLKLMEASFSFNMPYNPDFRHYNPATAGGGLLDAGVYPIEFAIGMAGEEPDAVTGLVKRAPSGVDNLASFSLSFPDGVLASLSCGLAVQGSADAWLLGTNGKILVKDFIRSRHCELLGQKGEVIEQFASDDVDGFLYEIDHFRDLFENGRIESPLIPWQDTLASARVIDQLLTQNA